MVKCKTIQMKDRWAYLLSFVVVPASVELPFTRDVKPFMRVGAIAAAAAVVGKSYVDVSSNNAGVTGNGFIAFEIRLSELVSIESKNANISFSRSIFVLILSVRFVWNKLQTS